MSRHKFFKRRDTWITVRGNFRRRSGTEAPELSAAVSGGEVLGVGLTGIVTAVLRMRSLSVIQVYEIAYTVAQFSGRIVLVDVNILAFQGSEPSLNNHVIHPSAFPSMLWRI